MAAKKTKKAAKAKKAAHDDDDDRAVAEEGRKFALTAAMVKGNGAMKRKLKRVGEHSNSLVGKTKK